MAHSQWLDPPIPEAGAEFGIGGDLDGLHNVGGVVCQLLRTCMADLNLDGVIDVMDLITLLDHWGTSGGDAIGDGICDISDVLALLAGFGPCT
ncbi:MAG: hypothetical protein MK100_01255 [Phycisphaerales bacterium]|nr:hypothetical protein [Phycisphaerales bacterium]